MDHLLKNYELKKARLREAVEESASQELTKIISEVIESVESYDRQTILKSYKEQIVRLVSEIPDDISKNLSALFIEHDIWGQEGYLYGYVGGTYPIADGTEYLDSSLFGEQDYTSDNPFDYKELWSFANDENIEEWENAYFPESGLFSFVKEYLASRSFLILGEVVSNLQKESAPSHFLSRVPIYANEHDMEELSISAI
jgi:hypothetical protein